MQRDDSYDLTSKNVVLTTMGQESSHGINVKMDTSYTPQEGFSAEDFSVKNIKMRAAETKVLIEAESEDIAKGVVSGTKKVTLAQSVSLLATAKEGYVFKN